MPSSPLNIKMPSSQADEMPTAAVKRRELIVVGIAVLVLLLSCIKISSIKPFWNDELYSWYFVADGSMGHLLKAFNDKINNTPILYFLIGWVWDKVFGASELSLRLFSSLGMGIACLFTWLSLRNNYRFWPTTLGTLTVFCSSEMVLSQNAEARMYGLFLALFALILYHFDQLNRKLQPSAKDYALVILLHAGLIHTHLFGWFYSAAILVSAIAGDMITQKLRPRLYAAVGIAWASLIFYIPAFLVQSDAGNPQSWLPAPKLIDLKMFMDLSERYILDPIYIVFILFAVAVLSLLNSRLALSAPLSAPLPESLSASRSTGSPSQNRARLYLLIVGVVLLLTPCFLWFVARTVKPIFYDRYMIPSVIGYSILIASALDQLPVFFALAAQPRHSAGSWRLSRKRLSQLCLVGLLIALYLYPLGYAQGYRKGSTPGIEDTTFGHENLPIVVQYSARFLERMHYSPNKDRYYFILDKAAAELDQSGQFGFQEYKHLDAFKRNYPVLLGDRILTSEQFLAKFDQFLVLDYLDFDHACPKKVFGLEYARSWLELHCPQWVETRLLNNPTYKVERLGEIYSETWLLVSPSVKQK